MTIRHLRVFVAVCRERGVTPPAAAFASSGAAERMTVNLATAAAQNENRDLDKPPLSAEEMLQKGHFVAKGKIQLEPGWKLLEGIDAKEVLLPEVNKGDMVSLVKAEVNEVERKPPKPHTEKTLLRVMETCGRKYEEKDDQEMMMAILSGFSIGTPATRAETIKKLKDAGYIQAKGKSLSCTELGTKLVETFPVRELFDLEYTGRLEKTLSDIERKKHTKKEFLDFVTEFVKTSVEEIKKNSRHYAKRQLSYWRRDRDIAWREI